MKNQLYLFSVHMLKIKMIDENQCTNKYDFLCYRPQTKVMFSQVFVCPRGSLSRRVSVQGGLWPGGSLAMGVSGQGVSVRGVR